MNNCTECQPSNLTVHGETALQDEIEGQRRRIETLNDQVIVDSGIIKAHFERIQELEGAIQKLLLRLPPKEPA